MKMYYENVRPTLTRIILLVLILVALPNHTFSQVIGKGYNNSLIYKIHSETNTVYLLGSLHALAEDFYPFTRAFSYAYYNSQKIIMEVDPASMDSPEGQKYISTISEFQNGMTLKKALSPRTYSLLKKNLEELGLNIRDFKKFKPWKVYLTAGGRVFDAKKDFRAHLGVESFFSQMAKDAGKETGGLETLKEHFNVFDNLSLKDQDMILQKGLLKSMEDQKTEEEEFIQLTTSWHQGKLDKLENFVEKEKSNPVFYDALLVKRNHNWLPKIEEYLKDSQNYLIIVGVAHLPGEDGLLALLSQKGYTLERLSFARP